MALLDQLGGLLSQYTGGQPNAAEPEKDLAHVAAQAPAEDVSHGLAQAFRSGQTPPFAQMVSELFSRSNPDQRAGLLNTLLGSGGSTLLARLQGLPGISSLMAGQDVTPEKASIVSPQAVEQLAQHAEQQNPNIVDRVSQYYSQHPQLISTIGKVAAAIAMMGIANRLTRRA